jgi:hypothetical protein
MSALSAGAAALYNRINAASSPDQLGELLTEIWRIHWPRDLSDSDAQFLVETIEKRKPGRGSVSAKPLAALRGRVSSRLTPRRCRRRLTKQQRTERRLRKRTLGGSSSMPDTMRYHYTEGERAVGCVVAGEIKRCGECTLSIGEIADRAGVGRTTVQNWQHEARRLGHINIRHRPQRGAKSLTNVITIVSAEWLAWIKRALSATRAQNRVQMSKNVSTTKSIDLRKKDASQGNARQAAPPGTGNPYGAARNTEKD